MTLASCNLLFERVCWNYPCPEPGLREGGVQATVTMLFQVDLLNAVDPLDPADRLRCQKLVFCLLEARTFASKYQEPTAVVC